MNLDISSRIDFETQRRYGNKLLTYKSKRGHIIYLSSQGSRHTEADDLKLSTTELVQFIYLLV